MERKRANSQRSQAWKYFIKKPGYFATCKLCGNDFSYKGSVSNLTKHCIRKHRNIFNKENNCSDDDFDSSLLNERKFSSERYFDVTDDDQVVRCKLCAKEVHQDSVADLIKHIVEEHGHFEDPDTEGGTNAPKTKLLVWLYYKPCADTEIAECLICRAGITYQDSVYSLKEHLETEHPLVKFDGGENGNRLLISADGDLYEVETESSRINHDEEPDQKDPIEMDTVYLEDYDELPDRATRKRPSFNRKKPTISYKMKQSDSFNNYNEDTTKRPSFKRKKRDLNYIKKEPLDNSSSDDGLAANKKLKDTRLELFGQYIISLLKELPKRLSDQLQGDIIKQVITAKGMYEAEKLNVTAPVSVSSVVTAPVTVTGTVPVTESIPVIMCNSDGSIKSIINS